MNDVRELSSLAPSQAAPQNTPIDLRCRLGALKFFAIISIAFCHAPDFTINTIAFKYISLHLTVFRLPLVFLLSGFFLLRKDLLDFRTYLFEVKKRLFSLAIPYLFWSVGLVFVLFFISRFLPGQFSGKGYSLGDGSFQACLDAIFGLGRPPIHYQFAFLKNLFLLVLLSPALRFCLERYPIVGLLLFEVIATKVVGIGYFYIGGLIWKFGFQRIFTLEKSVVLVLATLLVCGLAMYWAAPMYVLELNSFVFLLSGSTLLLEAFPKVVARLSSYSFIIFALHEPLITILGKILQRYQGDNVNSIFYIVAATATVAICIFFGVGFKYALPKLYSIAVGDR